MEKKGVAAVASFVAVALLAGILLGGTVARPPPVTITTQLTVEKTVTVAETTVEIPIRHQPVVYAAEAQTTCIFIVENPPPGNATTPPCTKAVTIKLWLRQLGTEESYISMDKVTVVAPGLEARGTVEGKPLDFKNRVVVPPRTRSEMTVTVPVRDLTSFINWLRDVGGISVEIRFEDYSGNEKGSVQVESIPVYERSWEYTNSTEAGPRG
jgi:hypothetical protein